MRPPTSESHVRLRVDGPVARIVLDAPQQHNALGWADVQAFRRSLATVETDSAVRVLVVTGAGDETFCAGASLAQMESGEMSGERFESLTDRLAAARVPTIAAINGSVYGGGVEIALCCDLRIGVRGARLRVPAADLGVCYPVGGLRRYVQRLGHATAMRILVAGEELDAAEMLRVGYLARLVEPGELDAATDDLARRLAGYAPLAIQAMKKLINDIAAAGLDEKEASSLVEACAASDDAREGLRAKREKREPRFLGE